MAAKRIDRPAICCRLCGQEVWALKSGWLSAHRCPHDRRCYFELPIPGGTVPVGCCPWCMTEAIVQCGLTVDGAYDWRTAIPKRHAE